MCKVIKEYDRNGNMIYYKNSDGFESWKEYDSNNNLIHFKDSKGKEEWREYDSNNNLIHYYNSSGFEYHNKGNTNFIVKTLMNLKNSIYNIMNNLLKNLRRK